MKKILVSAYAVSPKRGSECAVGWEITRRLGQYFDVTVLMCSKTPAGVNYKLEVEDYIRSTGKINNVTFIYVPMPKNSIIFTFIHDIGFWPAYYWGYNCWQRSAYKEAKKLHIVNKYDIAYQLNMIGFREPGYLWKLSIPFVWGPVGGFHNIPYSFLKSFKGKDYIFQNTKRILNNLQIKIAFRPIKAARKASLIWCVDIICQKKIIQWNKRTELLQETGLSIQNDTLNNNKVLYNSERTLKLVWSGMITPGKSLDILIDVLLINMDLNFELLILGDGPLIEKMRIKAKSINHKIIWAGWVKKDEACIYVKSSDMLIHTSLKEGTPHSILEAISYGVPVICHDTCGMRAVINQNNGFKIPYKDFDTSVKYISELLQSIFQNPQILNDKFYTIGQTTEILSWDHKVKHIASQINEIIK